MREDDGVGIYVIEKLKEKIQHENIEILDMGTSAFEVLFQLKGRDRIILIDAVINTGEEVGTLYKLPASEIEGSIKEDPLVFLHSLKWDQALSYAKKILLEEYPEHIDVYLVAIDSTRFNTEMTAAAMEGGDRLVDLLVNELEEKIPVG